MADNITMPNAENDVLAERLRQKAEEGWSESHDDRHTDGSLALAAAVYAWPEPRPLDVKLAWPWAQRWFKPTIPENGTASTPRERRAARRRDLVKAGALILAEIERLDRMVTDA